MIAQRRDLGPRGEVGPRHLHHRLRHLHRRAAPLIGASSTHCARLSEGKVRVHRHRDDGIGARDVGVLQPRAFRPEQNRDLAAARDHLARLEHRAFRRDDGFVSPRSRAVVA
jgi:hypothetical protein